MPPLWLAVRSWLRRVLHHRVFRRVVIGLVAIAVVVGGGLGGLTWRLSEGPISLNFITPLLVSAIQHNFGGQEEVAVGGTVLERDNNGHMQLRLTDVVLRDRDGNVIADSPKVEIGLSGLGLLIGDVHAERLRLVGAELSVRIEPDGRIAVFTGSNARPIAVAAAPASLPAAGARKPGTVVPKTANAMSSALRLRDEAYRSFAALLAWIDGLSHSGLDGHDLSELGLLNGTLVVDDRREGRRWRFDDIDLSLKRAKRGGVSFDAQSDAPGQRWTISAHAGPSANNRRSIQFDARRVPAKDVLLALRFAKLPFSPDLPLSASIHVDVGPTGVPEFLRGAIAADAGTISDDDSADKPLHVDHAEIDFDWDSANRVLRVPLQVAITGSRLTLYSRIHIPADVNAPWTVDFNGGNAIAMTSHFAQTPVLLNRIQGQARFDPTHRHLELVRAVVRNNDTSVALSGGFDFTPKHRVTLGLAARRMSLGTMKALWPRFIAPTVRQWVVQRISSASVERIDIAVNAPLDTLSPSGPPIPNDGLSVAVGATKAVLQPIPTLPTIHDADLDIRVSGHNATATLGHGAVTLRSGRELTVSHGRFRVPDTSLKPSPSQTRFEVEGSVAAAAELMTMGRLRKISGALLDPATSHGSVKAQVLLGMLLSRDMAHPKTTYAVDADFTGFSADNMFMSHRLSAAALHLHADNHGYEIKGDVKIAGTPASLDYRKPTGSAGAEVHLKTVLDDAMRKRLGLDLGTALTGPVPVSLTGTMTPSGDDGRFTVDADLTKAEIDELLPGLEKPPSKPAHATFTLVTAPKATQLQNLSLNAGSALVRGDVELDAKGNLVSASFPVFSPTSGDKVSLKAQRESDGVLKVVLHGDVYDGRRFVKSTMSGHSRDRKHGGYETGDLDLSVRLGVIAGFHGETLRDADLKLSRRKGQIRRFSLSAKLGRNGSLVGGLRSRGRNRPAILLRTNDAGAFFRFADIYARAYGGQMSVLMDAPTSDQQPQQGILVVQNFAVRGEAALDRVAAGAAPRQQSTVDFSTMRVDFTRSPGRLIIRNGVVRGPIIGATIDGIIDYRDNKVRMRGTFVPLYGLNNMFGQLPIVGLFLGGGKNEGLVGITYEVVGSPSAPVLRVNPISAVAPGFMRKLFEFPNPNLPAYTDPQAFDSRPH